MKTCIFFFIYFILFSCSMPTQDQNSTEQDESVLKSDFLKLEGTSVDRCIINDPSINPVLIVQNAYSNLFSGNLEGFLECVSDDVEFVHYGPANTIPVYGTYYGKEGVAQWAYNLFSSVQMNYFDIHYFVSEGNIVHAQVKEGCYSYVSGTRMYIENLHSFVINQEGKISRALILSETYTGVAAYFGETGRTYSTASENADLISSYIADDMDKFKVFKLLNDMTKNGIRQYYRFFSNNAEIFLTGPYDLVNFMGRFSGENDIKKFGKYFSKEIRKINIKYIIKQNNKINVYFALTGISSGLNLRFDSLAVFSFQFDDCGKIEKIYGYSDNYTISRDYAE